MGNSDSIVLLEVQTPARRFERRTVRRIKHARVSVLISILLHVSVVAIASFVAFGVSKATLHASKCSEPLVVTLLSETPHYFREPEPLQDLVTSERMRMDIEPLVLPTPTESETQVEQTSVENGFQDIEDGGSLEHAVTVRSGGGGGDDVQDVAELGHVSTSVEQWSRIKIKTNAASPSLIGVAGSGGGAVPGKLVAGFGNGLGNGAGSGALGSSGSGTGSGAGKGEASGNGMGTKPVAGITHGVRPVKISAPSYPSEAKRSGHEGLVKVTVEVLANGTVGRVELASSSGYGELDSAALSAARGWRFQPATHNGTPISTWVTVPYRYVLSR